MSLNQVQLLGRLGSDLELRYTPSGTPVANFSLATSEKFKDKNGEKQESTEWHRCVVWGKLAESMNQFLSKGRQIFAQGKLQTRSWEDKDGQKKYTTEIIVSNFTFADSRPQKGFNDDSDGSEPKRNEAVPVQNDNDARFTTEDIPF